MEVIITKRPAVISLCGLGFVAKTLGNDQLHVSLAGWLLSVPIRLMGFALRLVIRVRFRRGLFGSRHILYVDSDMLEWSL